MEGIYVRSNGKDYGPLDEKALIRNIGSGVIPLSAWIYTDDHWTLLASAEDFCRHHPEFEEKPEKAPSSKARKIEDLKIAVKPTANTVGFSGTPAVTVSAEPVWFVIRDKKKSGPYSAADVVGQLQAKELSANAFVWRPGFSTWQRLSQVSEFSKDTMRRLAHDGPALDILVKRKAARAPYDVEVIAHDNTRAIEGKTMVIGEGGLFLSTTKPFHVVGSRLKLHFREGSTSAFNAVAEVVSVVRGENPGYCLRFVAISDSDRKRIAKFVSERKG